jgi:hypothetical protein
MRKLRTYRRCIELATLLALFTISQAYGQVQIGGDFRVRVYNEDFSDTRDNRATLNSIGFLARLNLDAPVTEIGLFHVDLVTIGENPVFPTRSFAGLGSMRYAISQIYGEVTTPGVPLVDLFRLRIGRQHYRLGQGLTLGDSYYMTEQYDGVRLDMMRGRWTLGLMGAITRQELTVGGYYPKPGSDQIYVGKLEYELLNQVLLAYSVYERPQGYFNDNIIFGFGSNGRIVLRSLGYFAEFAAQRYNTLAGLPKKGGVAYMAGVHYTWTAGPFRTAKAEIRAAGYQGDDASTPDIEIFSPFYPSWWWGDQTAYANGHIGGDYPHRGIRLEGSRVWYGRFYVSPKAFPKFRLQFQYATVRDWVDNDGVTQPDDEFGVKLFYELNPNIRFQARYFRRIANSGDADLDNSGRITRIEDNYSAQRILFEFRVRI